MPPTSRSCLDAKRFTLAAASALVAVALLAAGCSPARSDSRPEKSKPVTKVKVSRGGNRPPGARPWANTGDGRAGSAPITATDACATQMHELCGPLLLYYALHRRLPERLEVLEAGADVPVSTTCPVSGGGYVYVPEGLPRGGGQPGFIIIHDPEPSHSGFRWAVVIEEPPAAQQPLVTRVVAVPESRFAEIGGGGGRAEELTPP